MRSDKMTTTERTVASVPPSTTMMPGNGVFVVRGEIAILATAMRRSTARWSSHSYHDNDTDPLLRAFQELRDTLHTVDDLRALDPLVYFGPFLDTIKSEDTTGPVTGLALSSVNKFLSYKLLNTGHGSVALTVHGIADAVTHARFVGADQSSDAVVLIKILQLLRTLTLSVEGDMLTNESLCEIMLSCFNICFETRLNELLRRTAEHYLRDMVQMIFTRLPQFPETFLSSTSKPIKMLPGNLDTSSRNSRKKSRTGSFRQSKPKDSTAPTTPTDAPSRDIPLNLNSLPPALETNGNTTEQPSTTTTDTQNVLSTSISENPSTDESAKAENYETSLASVQQEFINPHGVRFIGHTVGSDVPASTGPVDDADNALQPYGVACVRELFRFLVTLCNPLDRQNSEVMISLGLGLLTVAFEVAADTIGRYSSLMALVRDEFCRNLFSLLQNERVSVFAATLQLCFLLFESQRIHLKYQLQHYLMRLLELLTPDSPCTYERKELALDHILHLWRLPGFVSELYLNYDCDMYGPNLYEELAKLLAKNAFPAAGGSIAGGAGASNGLVPTHNTVFGAHLLSLDALLSVVEGIDRRIKEQSSAREDAVVIVEAVPTRAQLHDVKNIKRWLPTGTEHFNHKAKKGIQFLQEHDVLQTPMNAQEVVQFLRENPDLDKKQIGDFISSRHNSEVLEAFVKMFEFQDIRIDEALRLFLETFRLPGEAPLISMLLENFAAHWHKSNGEPFSDEDAAFTLAYAIIMLNVDQHNNVAKKQNNPMTKEDFKKNLKKVNGGADFDQDMLDEIYTSIKGEEIVMPAEQTGAVRDNYLWRVLLRRGASARADARYRRVLPAGVYDLDLFTIIWGPTVTALSYVYDRSAPDDAVSDEALALWRRTLQGFERCARISAHYGVTQNVDMLVVTLAKYTQLLQIAPPTAKSPANNQLHIQLGASRKAQLAMRSLFALVRQHGDLVREGWKSIFELVRALYVHDALPRGFVDAEDFIEPSGRIALAYEPPQMQKQDTGLLSSLYSYMVSSENVSRPPTTEEQEQIDTAQACIRDCNLEQMITDSKFLHVDALQLLVRTLIELSRGPEVQRGLSLGGYGYNENLAVFFLELLVKVVLQNRDRVLAVWQPCTEHLYALVTSAAQHDYAHLLQRSVVGLLRLAVRLMRNEDMSAVVLQSLHTLLLLRAQLLHRIARQIAYGLYELLKTSAQNVHSTRDWALVFTLLECVGAGAPPPRPVVQQQGGLVHEEGTKSEGEVTQTPSASSIAAPGIGPVAPPDRGYTSDSELHSMVGASPPNVAGSPRRGLAIDFAPPTAVPRFQPIPNSTSTSPVLVGTALSPSQAVSGIAGTTTHPSSGWILVGEEGEVQHLVGRTPTVDQYDLALEGPLGAHDPVALLKCCESLAFLVRDVAHITPFNFDECVHCIRVFVEASVQQGVGAGGGGKKGPRKRANHDEGDRGDSGSGGMRLSRRRQQAATRRKVEEQRRRSGGAVSPASSPDEDMSDEDDDVDMDAGNMPSGYHQVTIQLLDLMHTLHTRTAQIFRWWAEEGGVEMQQKQMSLWAHGWCPLLQGIARLCCDSRKQIRMSAITYLQRALLVHDLQTLNGDEWEACFHRVLFPLLTKLLEPAPDRYAMEETRMRAATVLSKVFLHHLTPLLTLQSFVKLWITILDFMDKYMHADRSDLLAEAIPESLKNMLLVMQSTAVFEKDPNLSNATWERIGRFLPNLRNELCQKPQEKSQSEVPVPTSPLKQTMEKPLTPHNIENATRSSIILQPPMTQPALINSPLFAHLGQMVSTPIGPPTDPVKSPTTLLLQQPTTTPYTPTVPLPPSVGVTSAQPGATIPSSAPSNASTLHRTSLNSATTTSHKFPVLYSVVPTVPISAPTTMPPLQFLAQTPTAPTVVTMRPPPVQLANVPSTELPPLPPPSALISNDIFLASPTRSADVRQPSLDIMDRIQMGAMASRVDSANVSNPPLRSTPQLFMPMLYQQHQPQQSPVHILQAPSDSMAPQHQSPVHASQYLKQNSPAHIPFTASAVTSPPCSLYADYLENPYNMVASDVGAPEQSTNGIGADFQGPAGELETATYRTSQYFDSAAVDTELFQSCSAQSVNSGAMGTFGAENASN